MIRLLIAIFLAIPNIAITCEDLTYKSNTYTLCQVTLDDDLRLFHSNTSGTGFGSFTPINSALARENKTLGFAMNAGMYHKDRSPVGLYVEDYTQYSALADGGSYGNFGLKPNGVFCIRPKQFDVIETNAFRADPPKCTFATQSGPMLVIDGKMHPRFMVNSTSKYIRNGVGVTADGTRAIFAISNSRVNFHDFGALFRDHLKTPNALYFDGSVSRLYAPDLNRHDSGFRLGAMIGTVISD